MIIGGGEVASRKVLSLVRCDAEVTVISPEVSDRIQSLARSGELQLKKRRYSKGDLDGAFLVIAATDQREVQQAVFKEAQNSNTLFNSADDPQNSSFHVPACIHRGDLLLTVSTSGKSPALSTKLKKELSMQYGVEHEQLIKLLGLIREKVVLDGEPSDSHKKLFELILSIDLVGLIKRGKWHEVKSSLKNILPEDINIDEIVSSIVSEKYVENKNS